MVPSAAAHGYGSEIHSTQTVQTTIPFDPVITEIQTKQKVQAYQQVHSENSEKFTIQPKTAKLSAFIEEIPSQLPQEVLPPTPNSQPESSTAIEAHLIQHPISETHSPDSNTLNEKTPSENSSDILQDYEYFNDDISYPFDIIDPQHHALRKVITIVSSDIIKKSIIDITKSLEDTRKLISRGWISSYISQNIGQLPKKDFTQFQLFLYTFSKCYYIEYIKSQKFTQRFNVGENQTLELCDIR